MPSVADIRPHASPSATVPRSKTVSITYVEPDGTEKTVDAEIGKNLMEIAHDHNVELEGRRLEARRPHDGDHTLTLP